MIVPSGMAESEVINSIQRVARNLSRAYQFGYHTKEDIEQEAFIIGMKALNKFDPNVSALETYLYLHINHRLRSFRRDKYERKDYVCSHCNNEDPTCEYCERRSWRVAAKKYLMEPLGIQNIRDENEPNMRANCTLLSSLEICEIFQIIDQYLPVELRIDYLRMLDGIYVPKNRRSRVEEAVISILEDHAYDY